MATNVKLLFFGATRDAVGEYEINFSLAPEIRASQALLQITQRYPRLASHKLLLALNQRFASGDEIIKDGDELAIFTAVSGG